MPTVLFKDATPDQQALARRWCKEIERDHEEEGVTCLKISFHASKGYPVKAASTYQLSKCPASSDTRQCTNKPEGTYKSMKTYWDTSEGAFLLPCRNALCRNDLDLGKLKGGTATRTCVEDWEDVKELFAKEHDLDNAKLQIVKLDKHWCDMRLAYPCKCGEAGCTCDFITNSVTCAHGFSFLNPDCRLRKSQEGKVRRCLASVLTEEELKDVELLEVGRPSTGGAQWRQSTFRLPTCGLPGCRHAPVISGAVAQTCGRARTRPTCPVHKAKVGDIDGKTFTCQSFTELLTLHNLYDRFIEPNPARSVKNLHDSLSFKLCYVAPDPEKYGFLGSNGVCGIPDTYLTLDKAWEADGLLLGRRFETLRFGRREGSRITCPTPQDTRRLLEELAGGPGKQVIVGDSKVAPTLAYKSFFAEGIKAVSSWGHTFEVQVFDDNYYSRDLEQVAEPLVISSKDHLYEWRDKYLEKRGQEGYMIVRVPYEVDADNAGRWKEMKDEVGNPFSFGLKDDQTYITDFYSSCDLFKDDQEDLDADLLAPATDPIAARKRKAAAAGAASAPANSRGGAPSMDASDAQWMEHCLGLDCPRWVDGKAPR